MSQSAENGTGIERLGEVIADHLALYTLPANYPSPYTMMGKEQTHDDVANRCGPIIAEAIFKAFPDLALAADEHLPMRVTPPGSGGE